jgi:hypothetical protein
MTAADVITAWDQADPEAIHPLRRVSEDAYWESGQVQAEMLAAWTPCTVSPSSFTTATWTA